MRDILVFLIVFGILPFAFSRSYIGVYLWSWIGYMNPHRLSWGLAYNFPFALVIAIVTIISFLIAPKNLKFFWSPTIGWLLLFNFWMLVTTIFATNPGDAWTQYDKVIKIQFMIFVALFVLGDREKIHTLIWIIVVSIGFYGFKGGIFTLMTGGGSHVLGPKGGFIEGNTEIGLALVMVLPLVWYLYLNTKETWARYGLMASMFLIPAGILGTQSRGAFLAIISISIFLWLKSRHKVSLFIAMLMLAPFLYMSMPESWHDRMATIKDPHSDASASQRFMSWEFGYTMALNRPIFGGGFESDTVENYQRYVPHQIEEGIATYHDYHSIYIEILAEHGFVGFFIFLMLFVRYWRTSSRIIKLTKYSAQNKWALDLASMLQVSFIGYAVGGAFLGLAYFDLFYNYLIILVLILRIVENEDQNDANVAQEKKVIPNTS